MDQQLIKAFRERLRRLERVLGSNLKTETECCGIAMTQCHALLEIASRGEASLVEVAEALGLDPSTLSRTVNAMVNLGWLHRNINPGDRRYVTLSLTESGRTLFAQIEQMNNGYFWNVFQLIPEEKHAQIVESLDLFLDAMQRSPRPEFSGCCGNGEEG